MIDEIKSLMDSYVGWLRDKTTLRPMGEIVEITTPFLDRHNDYLQIYASRSDGQILLTDDGYVLDDLLMSGCRLDSKKRQNLLKITLNGFGVQQEGNARSKRHVLPCRADCEQSISRRRDGLVRLQ
jgi:hypothetical protein